jgi:hypothetical protein
MAVKQSELFIAERVEALAIMHLTRRPDLTVRRDARKGDRVTALLVEITEGGTPAWKTFGVYLQGTKTPVSVQQANGTLKFSIRRFFANYGAPAIPFCLFYFTMEDNQGYFTWLAEPVVETDRFRLKYHKEKADCVKLDGEALDSIVEAVNAYYQALYSSAIKS